LKRSTASQAGVQIDLIVRGLSILRPGVKGLSENIRVRSIVGRFLEHSRIFHFANGGNDEIYWAPPDWMPRNLFERCEVVFPVRDPRRPRPRPRRNPPRLLGRHRQSRLQQPDGAYIRATKIFKDAPPFASQDFLMKLAEGKTGVASIPTPQQASPTPNPPPQKPPPPADLTLIPPETGYPTSAQHHRA